jgi:hypothetical protein
VAGSLLEHHRHQPQRRNGTPHGATLISELVQRRADEHSQTLVWSPDHLDRQAGAHRSAPVGVLVRRDDVVEPEQVEELMGTFTGEAVERSPS